MKRTAFVKIDQLSDLADYIGETLGISKWIEIEQKNIDNFAKATLDQQWIYTDTDAAEQYSPYGATVAQSFLILALIPKFAYEVIKIKDAEIGLNYGLDKVRFPNAVKVGSKIRGIVDLIDFLPQDGGARFTTTITIEIKGEEKPACVAKFIVQIYN